ncbi:MAG: heme exporter protein CcmB [Bacteroidia bacterium]
MQSFSDILNLHHINTLLRKEFLLEFRQKTALNGILLYVISTVFVCYLSFKHIVDPGVWNALFWVILLFGAINTASKSFSNEARGRAIYNYSIYSPQAMILSKMLYNSLLMCAVNLITLLFYCWFIGSLVQDLPLFVLTILLSSIALSGMLTLVAGISGKAGGSFTLMAILSFPVTLPLLLVAIKVSKNAADGLALSVSLSYIMVLALINVIVFVLAFLLFPYLWRD